MASAAITIIENPATIESDTTEAVITKQTLTAREFENMSGYLNNHGPADVWLVVSVVVGTAAVSVATTGAQAQLQIPLPMGASFPWLCIYASVAHKTAAGTATLSWEPSHESRRR